MSEPDSNICDQCGGILKVEYTMEFLQCRPESMRVTEMKYPHRLCPGHPHALNSGDWEKLTDEQKDAVNIIRTRTDDILNAITQTFHDEHPDLQLKWDFTFDVYILGD